MAFNVKKSEICVFAEKILILQGQKFTYLSLKDE